MNRRLAVLAGAVTVFAALAVAASSTPSPVVIPRSAARPAAARSLLGLIGGPVGSGMQVLARIDPRTLRPLRRPRTPVAEDPVASYSPDRRSLALGVAFDLAYLSEAPVTLRIVDVATLKTQARIRIGTGQPNVHWVAPNRIFVLLEHCCDAPGIDVVGVDPVGGRVVSRHSFSGSVVDEAPTADGVVLLIAPAHAIGRPSFVSVGVDGQVRSVVLSGIQAGWDETGPDADGNWMATREDVPGLAVDRAGGRAFVVSGDGPVAVVELASLAVRYVVPAGPGGPAKGEMNGPARYAAFVGGVLVVTGRNDATYTDAAGRPQSRSSPSGLWLVDTTTWRERLLDPRATEFSIAGDELLATGWSSDTAKPKNDFLGLSAYGFDGTLRFHQPPTVAAGLWLVYGNHVFVNDSRLLTRVRILDLRTGRVLGLRRTPLPYLLLPN